jgi:diaminopropionate ammonia-lyase
VVTPAGVGSLAHAVLAHYRSRPAGPPPAVLTVEPAGAACVLASLLAGEPRTVPTSETFMAGMNCGTPSAAAWPVLRDGLDAAISVTDDAAASAMADLADLGVSAGPCGAATLAGARAALAGPGGAERRTALGVSPASRIVLICTDGRASVGMG